MCLRADALVLPSHGLPLRGLHARLDALRAHHDARLAETLDALGEPRARLNYLEAAGSVTRTLGADGVERFRKA